MGDVISDFDSPTDTIKLVVEGGLILGLYGCLANNVGVFLYHKGPWKLLYIVSALFLMFWCFVAAGYELHPDVTGVYMPIAGFIEVQVGMLRLDMERYLHRRKEWLGEVDRAKGRWEDTKTERE